MAWANSMRVPSRSVTELYACAGGHEGAQAMLAVLLRRGCQHRCQAMLLHGAVVPLCHERPACRPRMHTSPCEGEAMYLTAVLVRVAKNEFADAFAWHTARAAALVMCQWHGKSERV